MSIRLKLAISAVSTAAALTFAGAAFAQSSADEPERIRGEIVSLSGNTLKVHRRSGETVTIDVDQNQFLPEGGRDVKCWSSPKPRAARAKATTRGISVRTAR